jgi:plastocyanin
MNEPGAPRRAARRILAATGTAVAAAAVAAAAYTGICSCGGTDGSGTATTGPATAATPAPTGDASITGTVLFEGPVPAETPPDAVKGFAGCIPSGATSKYVPTVVAGGGKLANAFVYVKAGLPPGSYAVPAAPIVVDQSTCEFQPLVFGAMVGQEVEFRNSDTLAHNANSKDFNAPMPVPGSSVTKTFRTAGVMLKIHCDIHPWMRAWAGVLTHPYFATTGADGAFALKGLVPGTYTVEVWHETLGTQALVVTVAKGEAKAITFTFKK